LIIGNRDFEIGKHTYIMGILNITPDSFSDGGIYQDKDSILKRVEEMIREGCDIIDVGGESTRPGYDKISDETEIERITPVIEMVKNNFNIPVSLDTYKISVANSGLTAGADMINDIWGLRYDRGMAELIANAKVPCCLMHNRKKIKKLNHDLTKGATKDIAKDLSDDKVERKTFSTIDFESAESGHGYKNKNLGDNFIADIKNDLGESLELARQAGISRDKIILDPGIGFGKTYEENLYTLNHLAELKALGYPCLLGASRKSVIGLTLNLPVAERLEGTIITTVMAVMSGYSFVRVHDIEANKRSIQMVEAILNAKL